MTAPPADLAAVTLPAPTVSAAAPQTTFNRVRGDRSGRHQADPAQTAGGPAKPQAAVPVGSQAGSRNGPRNGTQAAAQAQPRAARHAHGAGSPGGGSGSFFSRPPMPPLAPAPAPAPAGAAAAAGPDPAGPSDPEHREDSGWGAVPWERPGPAGSTGSSRPGGG